MGAYFPPGLATVTTKPQNPTTPAVPATTVPVTNSFPYDVVVYIDCPSANAVTIAVNGTTVASPPASSDATILLCPGDTITLTYTSAPTWQWRSL